MLVSLVSATAQVWPTKNISKEFLKLLTRSSKMEEQDGCKGPDETI